MEAYKLGKYTESIYILRPLAESGDKDAQYHIALIYSNGYGIPQDYEKSSYWYRKAADQGLVNAQIVVGFGYYLGRWGFSKDYVLSHMWLSLAASQGNIDGANERDRLARRMSPAEIAKAQKLARDWKSEGKGLEKVVVPSPPKSANPPPKSPTLEPTQSGVLTDPLMSLQYLKAPHRPDDVAVIIGNSDYSLTSNDIPSVPPAKNDAAAMRRYAAEALGIQEGNIIFVENATSTQMTEIFGNERSHKGKIFNWVKPGKSRVFVYYAGHGAPISKDTAVLVPVDATPSGLPVSGYPLNLLYANLAKLHAESVTVVLESCFSGASEAGAVIAAASPVLITAKPSIVPPNITVIAAGAADQIASWDQDKSHGLMTKAFLLGMSGDADKPPYGNGDGVVSFDEIGPYISENVKYMARRYWGRDQDVIVILGQIRDGQ